MGCHAKHPKADLLRVARTPGGSIETNAPGRGAYFCKNRQCWEAGIRKRGVDRTLRRTLLESERQALLHVLDRMREE